LVQSQERSGGIVVYTGMNNNGDSFIGNRKTSSSTGEEVTFDNPIPTVTGEDPSRLSAVFDEVTIKERLVVEGGNSGTVLSQFDGPVTFNKEVKFTDTVNVKSQLKVSFDTESTTTTNGALIVSGGVGIVKNLNVGGTTTLTGLLSANGSASVTGTLGVSGATTLSSTLGVTGATTLSNTLGVTGATTLSNTLGVTGATTLSSTLGVTGATTLSAGLTVSSGGISASGQTITATTFSGNATSASTSANLSFGSANEIVFKNSSNTAATTSSKLTFNNTTGVLTVDNDIIAFASDERLKENIQPLENALDKVLALSGFTYNFNEIGQSLGFDGSVRYVGVSAQEVQEVLPEAVKPAPADSNYITVQYEKLVPLLIEAIKELKEEINELKRK
jgi:hypothetical protein